MILGLQVTGIIFAVVMIYMSLVHYKKGALSGIEIASWIAIWVSVILAVIFPEILRTYARTFAVSRLFDLLVVGAFIVVMSLVTSAFIKVKNLEKKLEELIRKNALSKK